MYAGKAEGVTSEDEAKIGSRGWWGECGGEWASSRKVVVRN